jgi:Gpi18-like mannosyltransferase
VATAFYSFWGGAVFYSAIYSEALFMALALGAFYYLEEDKLPIAVIFGFLASFTRSDGLLICIPFLIYALQSIKNKSKTVKLLISSALVASPFLIFQFIGYIVAGGVFPITVVAHNLNWGIYPLLTTQLASISSTRSLIAFYILGLMLILLPTAYFVSRLCSRSIKNNLIQESKRLKYWAFYAAMVFVIIYQSYIFSIIRYALPMLPIYWVSAIIFNKNRWIGIAIFAVMTGMLIIGSYMFEIGGSFM